MNNEPWFLFLDDQTHEEGIEFWRKAPEGEPEWRTAVSTAEAIQLVINYGPPTKMDLDHDLSLDPDGNPDTAMNFLSWLFQMFPDAIDTIKDWNVHSVNPNGVDNINAFLRSWKKSRWLK